MKKKYVYLIVVVTLFNLVAISTIFYHYWIDHDRCTRATTRGTRFEKIKRDLALTPAQINHFVEIRSEFHSGLDSLDQVMKGIRIQLLREVWLTQQEDALVDSLLHQISQLQMESQRLVIWHFSKFKEVLTPEQWQKFYVIASKRHTTLGRVSNSKRSAQTEKDCQ